MKTTTQRPKKPYERPLLRVYGDIRTLTATVHMGSKTDATFMMATKTN